MKSSSILTVFVFSSAFLAIGCSPVQKDGSTNASTSTSAQTPVNFVGTAGVKNVNQILLSMTGVTGIQTSTLGPNGSNAAITTQYQTISPFLSTDGSVDSINPAMLLSLTGLAGQVCQVFAANEATGVTNILGKTKVSFTASNWSSQFASSSAVPTAIVNALSTQFWGRAPSSDELNQLTAAITSASVSIQSRGFTTDGTNQPLGTPSPIPNSTSGVQDVLIVPCTIMLASPAFLIG